MYVYIYILLRQRAIADVLTVLCPRARRPNVYSRASVGLVASSLVENNSQYSSKDLGVTMHRSTVNLRSTKQVVQIADVKSD